MGSILDALGALMIGSIFLITMFNALVNFSNTGYNLNMFHTLKSFSDDVFTICDSLYLKNVGSGVPDDEAAILTATPTRFRFRGKIFGEASTTDTVDMVMAAKDRFGYPLTVYRNGLPDAGPFWLADSLHFTYFDRLNAETIVPDSVFSIRVDMNLSFDRYAAGEGTRVLHYPLTFWRYFYNLYQ